jgi:hypothetical protein
MAEVARPALLFHVDVLEMEIDFTVSEVRRGCRRPFGDLSRFVALVAELIVPQFEGFVRLRCEFAAKEAAKIASVRIVTFETLALLDRLVNVLSIQERQAMALRAELLVLLNAKEQRSFRPVWVVAQYTQLPQDRFVNVILINQRVVALLTEFRIVRGTLEFVPHPALKERSVLLRLMTDVALICFRRLVNVRELLHFRMAARGATAYPRLRRRFDLRFLEADPRLLSARDFNDARDQEPTDGHRRDAGRSSVDPSDKSVQSDVLHTHLV